MNDETEHFVVGEYFLAVEGLAMIRRVLTAPSSIRPRVDDMRRIVAELDDFPYSLTIPLTEHDVEDGYTKWAPRYDGPNPAIEIEQPIVHGMLEAAPPGDALDAACGTGRHAARLAELGHRVVGVDTTEGMLAIAREKAPGVDFRTGRLEHLPLADASMDLITCSLALTHVEQLEPVMREFARVLRPNGRVILSDMHPFATMTGSIAGFPEGDITQGIPYVVNLTHQISDYISAFRAAGLSIADCREPLVDEQLVQRFPSSAFLPEATREAFLDTPYLLIWRLDRPRG